MTKTVKWLEKNAPGFESLKNSERQTIFEFSLLWSLFEFKVLDTHGNVGRICAKIDNCHAYRKISAPIFEPELSHFRKRYFSGGTFTSHFDGLKFQDHDNIALVQSVLADESSNPLDSLKACLIIIYRYRNNLFHGPKWENGIKDQEKNFAAANSILIKVMDRYGNLSLGSVS